MLIPVRRRADAAADQGKKDEEWENYNNMGAGGAYGSPCVSGELDVDA